VQVVSSGESLVASHLSTAVCTVHVTEPALALALTTDSVHTMLVVVATAASTSAVTAAVAVIMLMLFGTGSAMVCSKHVVGYEVQCMISM
jgi:hypothetical protein